MASQLRSKGESRGFSAVVADRAGVDFMFMTLRSSLAQTKAPG